MLCAEFDPNKFQHEPGMSEKTKSERKAYITGTKHGKIRRGNTGEIAEMCAYENNIWNYSEEVKTMMAHGNKYEQEALDRFSQETGHLLVYPSSITNRYFPSFRGNPDAVTLCEQLVEVKCPYTRFIPKSKKSKLYGKLPSYYKDQFFMYMVAGNFKSGYYIEYRPKNVEPKYENQETLHIVRVEDKSVPFVEHLRNWTDKDFFLPVAHFKSHEFKSISMKKALTNLPKYRYFQNAYSVNKFIKKK